jgi:hypothetical protein
MSEQPWIEWAGGECPVPADTLVYVRYADETTDETDADGNPLPPVPARFWGSGSLSNWQKSRKGNAHIIAYRVVPA